MTDLENSTTPEGGAAPSVSSQAPVATSSQATPDLEAVLKRMSDLEAQLRAQQSGKDKGVFKLEKKVDELLDRYEQYRQEMTPAKARREIQLDALLEQSGGEPVPSSTQPAPGSAPAGETRPEVGVVLTELGLDANDPQVLEAIRLPYGKREAQLTKLALLRNQAPNPATVQNTGGGAAVAAGDDLEAIEKKLAAMKSLPAYRMDNKEYHRLVAEKQRLLQQ